MLLFVKLVGVKIEVIGDQLLDGGVDIILHIEDVYERPFFLHPSRWEHILAGRGFGKVPDGRKSLASDGRAHFFQMVLLNSECIRVQHVVLRKGSLKII